MKMKKGKVYPSPPSSFSSQHLNEDDYLSVLKLLPATILVLVSALSAQDRQVLAYLITRGTTISSRGNSTGTGSSSSSSIDLKKAKKNKSIKNHTPPVFDCECFDCYTNYWFLWDSSPNRELIHVIIEAYENHNHHLTLGENSTSRNKSKRGKKKDKSTHRNGDKDDKPVVEVEPMVKTIVPESHMSSPGRLSEVEEEPQDGVAEDEEESTMVLPAAAGASRHKGLARKVLPDVLGLINSNIWKLWNPNA